MPDENPILSDVYQTLGYDNYDIRLLTIHARDPDAVDSTVSCTLERASLLTSPSFSALSYVWGQSTRTRPIQINGRHTMQVTTNLEAAFRKLRERGKKRVWVDAVCINQADLEERGSQVTRMSLIYSKAKSVIVWLGEEASDFVGLPMEPLSHKESKYSAALDRITAERTIHDDIALRWVPILAFNPFWKRVWIIQEISKGKRVQILGDSGVWLWDNLVSVLLDLHGYHGGTLHGTGVRHMLVALQAFRKHQQADDSPQMCLLEALIHSRKSQATDPRDKIYALLGLVSDSTKIVPTPNYMQTAEEVYFQTTRLLFTHKHLSSILLARRAPERLADLPSWYPDWSKIEQELPPWIVNSIIHSCHARSPKEAPSLDSNVLKVSGFIFDTVNSLSSCIGVERHSTDSRYNIIQETTKPTPIKPWWHKDRNWPAMRVRKNIWDALTLRDNYLVPRGQDNLDEYMAQHQVIFNDDVVFEATPPANILPLTEGLYFTNSDKYILSQNDVAFAILVTGGWRSASPAKAVFDKWLSINENFLVDGRTMRGWAKLFMSNEGQSVFKKLDKLRNKRTGYYDLGEGSVEHVLVELAVNTVNLLVKHKMRLVTTAQGQVLWVYQEAQKGDRICVLQHCMRVILRPDGNKFRYVGEAIDPPTYNLVRGTTHYHPNCTRNREDNDLEAIYTCLTKGGDKDRIRTEEFDERSLRIW